MAIRKTDVFDVGTARLARMFKALGHPARVEILRMLAQRGTCICGEIVDELPLAQATVSQHLKALKEVGLIRGEIDGPAVCYCVNQDALDAMNAETMAYFSSVCCASPCGIPESN
jgi:ArsR family transcriptional regulator